MDITSTLPTRYARSRSMVFRKIADETVLVPIASSIGDMNAIYTLNRVGCRIWELLDGEQSLEAIADIIVGEFEVSRPEAEADLVAFIQELEEVGAVQSLAP